MINIYIPSFLRPHADRQATVQVAGRTVGEAIEALVKRHPNLKPHLFKPDGERLPFVHVFKHDTDIRTLEDLRTPLSDQDEITLVVPVAGG